ncbi:MAG: RHS repeat protein [Gammaproteobacteria bacterium]|nr:MAG: RHS repeat protein [Gammaproteobacteria bacterium]
MEGICPGNLAGYSIKDIYNVDRYGYIACPVPSYPDGEKDLAKPEECGDRTPNPVYLGLGRKELTIPIYRIGSSSFPIDFQLFYQHNDTKRSSTTWRHSYYKFIVLDGLPSPVSARIYRGRGAVIFNKNQTTGEWHSDIDINDSLIELFDDANNRLGWVYRDSLNDRIEKYDVSGKLLSVEDRSGITHSLTYSALGNLSRVADSFGNQLQFTHDDYGNFATLTGLAGNLYRFTYQSNGNLTSVTFPDGKVRTYHYSEPAFTSGASLPNALTGITDENGVRFATYTYDAQGRAVVTEHAGGVERYVLGYSADGSSTLVTDSLNSQYTHHFQTILGVAKSSGQSQPAGSGCSAASSATTYDVNGNVASRADFNGNKTCYAYDLTRNLETARIEGLSSGSNCPGDLFSYTAAANSSERKILTAWHANFRLPVKITEAGRETGYVYDTHGNVAQHQIKDTATNATRAWSTNYVYHPSIPGVILQKIEDGPRTDVTDITTTDYYAPDAACTGGHSGCRGEIASITNALGHVTQITRYNAHGQPEEIVDPNGLVTSLTYDVRQRILSRTVGTEITRYQYDGVGQLQKITLPDGSFLSYTYDAAHRLTAIADNLGNRVQYTLDAMGNRTKEELFDPLNNLTKTQQRGFDALNRLWKDTGAQSQTTQYQYDAQGNLKQVADPLLHTATYQFDTRNRLKETIDPANGHTQQTLDALDRLTQVTDPRNIATTYTVSGFGDLTQEVSADRGTATYTYDSAGNLKTVTDARGVKHTYTWDALNRPTQRTHATVAGIPGTTALTWSYDAGSNGIGRLTGLSDESGSTSFSYDSHGRLLNTLQIARINNASYTQTLSYHYDSLGRLDQTTYPSGTQITTSYGADGRPSEIRVNGNVLLNNITYHPFGTPKSWVWGNGQAYTRSFDLDGRLKTHSAGGDTRTLIYDPASRITQTTGPDPVYNRSYDYDVLNRLISQSDNSGFKLWDYDPNSNRTQAQFGATGYPYTIASDSNRLMNVAGPVAKTYSYDAAGYPLSDGIATFTWNAAGKLSMAIKSGKTHTYKYNALDQRIIKNGPLSPKFFFFYDPNGQLIGEYRDDAITAKPDDWLMRQETVWLGDIPVAVIKKNAPASPIQVYFIHADHLNTPRVIVNTNNTAVWRWDNTHAFGANLANESPLDATQVFEYNLRFPGQYFDKETNLHYNYFRYYEPETGRYISPDPIGLMGGMNIYTYVNGAPTIFTDPTGENPLLGAAIGAFGDIAIQLASNGMRFECIKWGVVGIAALAGAINPFSGLKAANSALKAQRQFARAERLRQGSRASKRTAQRGWRHNSRAFEEFASWVGVEGTAEGVGNLIPNERHIRIENNCECN